MLSPFNLSHGQMAGHLVLTNPQFYATLNSISPNSFRGHIPVVMKPFADLADFAGKKFLSCRQTKRQRMPNFPPLSPLPPKNIFLLPAAEMNSPGSRNTFRLNCPKDSYKRKLDHV